MFDLYSRIEELCREKHVNITTMCREAGVSRSAMTELKSGRTKTLLSDTASKISSYFGVSVDYLLGKTDTKKVPVQAEETGNNISFEEFERMVNDVKTGRGNEKAVIAGFGKDGNDIIHISQEEFDVAWAAIEALRKSRKKKHEK